MTRRALVTGAYGFLGTAIAARLEQDGWDVARAGRPQLEIPSAKFAALVQDAPPEVVVHCAGPASVHASVADPDTDRVGSIGVLSELLGLLAVLAVPPRVILLSSAAVYGQPERLPVREGDPLAPISPYGANRVEAERILRTYAATNGVETTALRVFSAYGERLARQVLWDISRKALSGEPVVLAGTGDESRDFVHVEDVAQAVAIVARREPPWHEVYNVAAGEQTAISDLAVSLLDALGVDLPVAFSGETRTGDPDRWQADIGRLRSCGFVVSVPLAAGVQRYAAWVRSTAGARR